MAVVVATSIVTEALINVCTDRKVFPIELWLQSVYLLYMANNCSQIDEMDRFLIYTI